MSDRLYPDTPDTEALVDPANEQASTPAAQRYTVDWGPFYTYLGTLHVTLPRYDPGDAISPGEVQHYMVRIQTARQYADQLAIGLDQKIGQLKRKARMLDSLLRSERVMYRTEPSIMALRSAPERAQHVEELCMPTSTRLAMVRGAAEEAEAARRACTQTVEGLKTAKETMNALARMAEASMRAGVQHR